jgi:mycobactin lysine-N-oxygenase
VVTASAKKRIAIIGGGAKAAALAARAEVLNRFCGRNIELVIFEEKEVGANWSGAGGYTDGEARLCTPAERDLGFPYDTGKVTGVAEALHANYSWPAYLIATAGNRSRRGYKDWVNRGRRPPSHAEFAAYLAWAIDRSKAKVVLGHVSRLQALKGGWRVHSEDAAGLKSKHDLFNGIVVTGPGPALNRIKRSGSSDRIVDGRDFWRDPAAFLARGASIDEPVVIVGAGGTSAAIAARAVREPSVSSVMIIGDQAALFARTETFFESQIFSDDELWKRLSPQTRRDFTDRLNRGVVWATISEELSRSNKVRFEPGRGQLIDVSSTTTPKGEVVEELKVHFSKGAQTTGKFPIVYGGVVVDASGFDSWWFVSALPKKYQKRALGKDDAATVRKRRRLSDAMGETLALFDDAPGPIHAPMLSQAVGPGFASLMVLGTMSERILSHYEP